MNQVELLTAQTENTYEWLNKIIGSLPVEKWELIPEGVGTNVSWQVGHLVISIYFHSILVVVGHQPEILERLPLREYNRLYTQGSPLDVVGQRAQEQLRQDLMLVEQKSLDVLHSLNPEILDHALEPSQVKHPVASTKFEAIDWNIKHTMWHCGQLGMLKRLVDERFDFGLRL